MYIPINNNLFLTMKLSLTFIDVNLQPNFRSALPCGRTGSPKWDKQDTDVLN